MRILSSTISETSTILDLAWEFENVNWRKSTLPKPDQDEITGPETACNRLHLVIQPSKSDHLIRPNLALAKFKPNNFQKFMIWTQSTNFWPRISVFYHTQLPTSSSTDVVTVYKGKKRKKVLHTAHWASLPQKGLKKKRKCMTHIWGQIWFSFRYITIDGTCIDLLCIVFFSDIIRLLRLAI